MHRELGIKDGYRIILNSAEAELGIQEFDVNDILGNAKPKDIPTVSELGSYDYDQERHTHHCRPSRGLGSIRLRTTRGLCDDRMEIEQESFACQRGILGS